MPGTWPEDDDAEPDEPVARGPVHPDDRLWRHPSEVAWMAQPSAAGPAAPAAERGGRVWALAVTSGLTGAALALGVVALVSSLGTSADGELDGRVAFTGTAATTPTGLAAVAEAVLPSVVRVEVDGQSGGTGVVVLDDGHVLTSAEVVDGAEDLRLVVSDGTVVPARIVGIDLLTDLAVVAPVAGHGDDVDWTAATLAEGSTPGVGEAVVAVGAARADRAPTISVGVVAAVGTRMGTARGSWLHGLIETDAPIAPGGAGGALCDRTGAVVGLSTSASGDSGAGYATPIDLAWAVAEALMADGEVHHVWLGIEGADLADDDTAVAGIAHRRGVVVQRVVPGSPAEAAGLLPGDELVAVGDRTLTSMDDLVVALRHHRPGDEVTVAVRRDGEPVDLAVTLAEREG